MWSETKHEERARTKSTSSSQGGHWKLGRSNREDQRANIMRPGELRNFVPGMSQFRGINEYNKREKNRKNEFYKDRASENYRERKKREIFRRGFYCGDNV